MDTCLSSSQSDSGDFIAPATIREIQQALMRNPLAQIVRSAPGIEETMPEPQSKEIIKLNGGRSSMRSTHTVFEIMCRRDLSLVHSHQKDSKLFERGWKKLPRSLLRAYLGLSVIFKIHKRRIAFRVFVGLRRVLAFPLTIRQTLTQGWILCKSSTVIDQLQ